MLGTDALGCVVLAHKAEERDGSQQERDDREPLGKACPAGEVGRQHEEDHVQEPVHDADDLGDVGAEGLQGRSLRSRC